MFLMLGYSAVTGNSTVADLEAHEVRSVEAALRLAVSMSLCIGVAAFLATYAMDCIFRGCTASLILLLLVLAKPSLFVLALVLIPAAIGGIAGRYLNTYAKRHKDSRFFHTGFRALILVLCSLALLAFVPDPEIPLWIFSTAWVIKCGVFLSGAIHSVWMRYPVTQHAG